jgi:HEAT repeat protein
MRSKLRRWQLDTRDAGFLTEPQMWSRLSNMQTPWDIVRDRATYPLERVLDAAGAVGRENAADAQRRWLEDSNDAIRYWAAVGFGAKTKLAMEDKGALRSAISDSSSVVRIEVASALAHHGDVASALPVLLAALQDESQEVVLHAARALELLGPAAHGAQQQMSVALARAREQEVAGNNMSMFIRFALEAALSH